MFGGLDSPLNASRGLSAIAEFLVTFHNGECYAIKAVCLCICQHDYSI